MATPAAAGFYFAPFQFRQVKSLSSSDKPSISLHAPLGISPLSLFVISKNPSRRDVSSRCSVDPNTLLEEEEEAEAEAAEKRRELNSTNLPWDTPAPRVGELFDQCGAEKDVEETTLASTSVTAKEEISNSLKFRECQNGKLAEDVAAVQGVKIRRRPPTGPSKHYVGPFEFRLENEGNTPRNILEKIIWDKELEVTKLKERRPLITIMKALENAPPVRDFIGTLKASYEHTGMPALIAEVKKASPSRGVLRENFDPVEVANSYEKNGAACISVLTDEKYFQGSFENLEAIRRAGVKCPLLCKEFIVDAWQIYYARSKGADAILLIAAVLADLDIKYLTKICRLLGLAALIEVHNESELDRVLGIEGVQLIGINNRNLETFEVDISNTKSLLDGERGELIRQRDIIVVSESGLFTPEDISYVQDAGIKAVLVGESLIKQDDPGGAISGLFGKSMSVREGNNSHVASS
ncbi:indole-3-glycerol phosphate synthase, chloroplastic-like [Zingiber officinale]|uniref:indole-3-glycerol phosphate synthase, chloroplastic-like n=1 Tax=Zingiber officinale TaxID=94328 RepID=UPI001C4D2FA9|nr:indole-3-glycerol phosphate synthase, chloroplastic-like [Zingiber officinale]